MEKRQYVNRYLPIAVQLAIDELDLQLKERHYSKWWYGFCPLHENNNTPALAVNVDTGGWKCWAGCGESDDIAKLISLATGESLSSVRRRLYKLLPDDLNETLRDILLNLNESISTSEPKIEPLFYDRNRVPKYLLDRGFDKKTLKKWGIGWDIDLKAAVIPVYSEGKLIGLIRRLINPPENMPKYLYTSGLKRSEILFGIEHIPKECTRVALVEGSLDAIWLNAHGIPAVALLGASLSLSQASSLRKRFTEVVMALDNDEAGHNAEKLAVNALSKMRIYCIELPDKVKDVQELNSDQLKTIFDNPVEIWYHDYS